MFHLPLSENWKENYLLHKDNLIYLGSVDFFTPNSENCECRYILSGRLFLEFTFLHMKVRERATGAEAYAMPPNANKNPTEI